MFLATIQAKVRYGALFLIASGSFAFGTLCNANVSANVLSETARSAIFSTIGELISTWSFLPLARTGLPYWQQSQPRCSINNLCDRGLFVLFDEVGQPAT
jgi:hypothetical protein